MNTTQIVALVLSVTTTSVAAQAPFRATLHHTLPPLPSAIGVCAGDVDGDGDIDLVVANNHDPNLLLLNDGRGRFVDATAGRLTTPGPYGSWPYVSTATRAADLADIDGDGDLDLLLVNAVNLSNRVHRNDGTGVFTDVTATALPQNASWAGDQIVADFDGDGDVDWMVQQWFGPPELYLNDGTGVFTDVTATNVLVTEFGSNWPTGCMATDLDQDGDLDALLPRPDDSPLVLINQGGAVFVPAPAALSALPEGHAYARDFDRDGRDDLFVDGGRLMLRNLGNLTFAAGVQMPASVDAFDYDEDGDVDLVRNGRVERNEGGGVFTTLIAPGLAIAPGLYCAADFDGDADIDFANARRIAANFLRQVDTLAPPTLGQLYAVDYHCPIDSGWALLVNGVSTAPATIPLPGVGLLRLDPTRSIALPSTFATGGFAQMTHAIPNAAVLSGIELHFQSLVFDPLRIPRLTNAIRDVVQ